VAGDEEGHVYMEDAEGSVVEEDTSGTTTLYESESP
jgi:hypothetical protein